MANSSCDYEISGEEIVVNERLAVQRRVSRSAHWEVDPNDPRYEDETVSFEITELGRLALRVCTVTP